MSGLHSASEVERLNAEVPELMGAYEVAQALGVEPSNIGKVANLPAPCQDLQRGKLWRADVIRGFAKRRAARRNGDI